MTEHARLTDRDDWFDIWFSDKNSMVNTMVSNMVSDLENGYEYFGASIVSQREAIDEYKKVFDLQMDNFKTMEETEVNRFCFYDMKKRGVIC